MISSLKGKLIYKQAPEIIVECAGVGYGVTLPWTSFNKLPELEQEIFIFTHQRILEDRRILYGFHDQASKNLFLEIIKINKVGPAIALAILSSFTMQDFVELIAQENVHLLTSVPGVGAKTAERIILELKTSLNKGKIAVQLDSINLQQNPSHAVEQAIYGLEGLGLSKNDAIKIIKQVNSPGMTTQELIAASFKIINSK